MSNENLNAAPAAAPAAPKTKMVAGLLAIFLGCFGAHKFYLGYKKEGLILLLVTLLTCCTASTITSTIGIIEGIIMLMKTEEDFQQTYVANQKPWF